MIKYIELTKFVSRTPILFKMDSIRELAKATEGEEAIVNGILVKESYNYVKLLLIQDERRVCHHLDTDERIKWLIRNSVWNLVKEFGEEQTLSLIKDIIENGYDYGSIYEIEKKYYNLNKKDNK